MKAQKFTLLLVDDDEAQRFFMERSFAALSMNYRIHLLSSGNEAIAYLKGEGKFQDRSVYEFPSYIITDLKMAPGDGFDILQFIKSHPALSIIPVVMLSTSDDPDDVRHAYVLGASSYFTKPMGTEALTVLFRKIHDYWSECEVPEVDAAGNAVPTNSKGRASDRFKVNGKYQRSVKDAPYDHKTVTGDQ